MRRRHAHRCAERTNTTILKTHGVVRAEIVQVPSVFKIFELRMLAVAIGDKRTYICIQSPAQQCCQIADRDSRRSNFRVVFLC